MKKTLLFIFLFISSFSFSQINALVSDYRLCDSNGDGFEAFDLTSKIPEILGNLNPTTHIVTFYVTQIDAQNQANPIINTTSFFNYVAFSQQIYVSVRNIQTNELQFTSFTLQVGYNAGTDGSILVCNSNNTPIDLFNIIAGEQAGGTWVRVSGFGGVFNAANATFIPEIGITTTSTFVYTITGNAPCPNDSSVATILFDPNCNTSPICNPPTNITVSSITSTSAVISWTASANTTLWEILILPFGSPTPTATTSGAIFSQSNPFVLTGLTSNTCYTVYVRSVCVPGTTTGSIWSSPVNFCMFNCENNAQCPESLGLIAFVDLNTNGVKDSGEPIFNNGNFAYQINSGTPIYGNTNSGIFNIFENNPANSYNLSFAVNSNLASYYSSSATYSNITVPTGSGSTTYYFPVTQLQAYNDLEVQIIPGANPRPGFPYTNTIIYKNKGTQNVASGTVTFTKNSSVSISSISQTGTTTLPSGFSYNFTNLAVNEARLITITMQVPTIPTVNLNDVLTNSATITPSTGDAFPLDNSASLSQIVVGSYDPNDKMEAHGGKINITNFTANDYFVYTIRFENTGTANASFIRVEDELNALLNAGTVQVLNASHAYNFRRINNKLIWNFYNINLPPTATNPTLSHGFVQFKVKPNPGYIVGTVIPNSGEIYFDYNPPIFTGTFNTEFVAALNNSNFNASNFVLYPNPTSNFVMINMQNTSEKIDKIIVYNMIGKVVKSISNVNSNQVEMSTSEFSKGMYLIEIYTESNLKQTKKLIVK